MRKSLTIFMLITALVLLSPVVSGLVISPVCTAPGDQMFPVISGDTIVWQDARNFDITGWDIYKWDPVNGEQPVCTVLGNQENPVISGSTIVWMDDRNSAIGEADIYKWDPVNGEQPVCTAPRHQFEPAISGDTIVWSDWRDYEQCDIYKWNPVNGEQLVCTDPGDQFYPAISGDTIVWQDWRDAGDWQNIGQSDIYMWDPVNGEQVVTAPDQWCLRPDISENTIVWWNMWEANIYKWDLINGEQPVSTGPDGSYPAISGDTIVWQTGLALSDIYMWDPVNGEQPVCTDLGDQYAPDISGNIIVWEDTRNYYTTGRDIYMADLSCWLGFSLGYWKIHESEWTTYSPSTTVNEVFTAIDDGSDFDSATIGNENLADALKFKGGKGEDGGARILLKQAVAALLNEAQFSTEYPPYDSESDLIDAVNTALNSNNRATMLELAEEMDSWNNPVECPS